MFDKDNKFGFVINNNNNNSNNSDIKKYVDDKITIKILPVDVNKNYRTNVADLEGNSIYMSPNDAKFLYLAYEKLDGTIVGFHFSSKPHGKFVYTGYKDDSRIEIMLEGICYTAYFKTDTEDAHTETTVYYLTKNNTIKYTPTADYHPATKKYVDDNKIAYTISNKVLTTVPASNVKLNNEITVNNISINKDRKYYIEFLGNKKLCSLSVDEELGNAIICNIGNYAIQVFNDSTNISVSINKINEDTTDTFTDLVIYEEEVKCLDNKYLENDLVLQNSISLGRIGNIGTCSSAIGYIVEASGDNSHAEGYGTKASGTSSHSEGSDTKALGMYSHAEGSDTNATGEYSHAEGDSTIASGNFSHAEGNSTTASGLSSHSEGDSTIASGLSSHSEGDSTIASGDYQHVQGKYNIEDTTNKYSHIVGNGTNDNKRSNAHTLDWEGNGWFAGKLSQEGTPTEDKDLVTKKYIDDSGYINEIKVLPVEYDNGKIVNVKNLEAHSTYICPNDVDLLDLEYEKESKLVAFLITPNKEQLIYVGNKTDKQIELMVGVNSYVVHFKTETQAGSMEKNVYYLTPNNNTAFTPTKDYNPVHKKYVDDKVSSLPQFSFNESGELVVTINGVSKTFVPKE